MRVIGPSYGKAEASVARAAANTEELLVDIREIEQLDESRSAFMSWRTAARSALKHFVGYLHEPAKLDAERWKTSMQVDDKAMVVKALSRPGVHEPAVNRLLEELRSQTLKDLLGTPENSPLFDDNSSKQPFLVAAYTLDALAGAREAVLSPATALSYYAVIRELYYPTAPLWMVGGARAGAGGKPTAFTTSQCVRGILSVARMLDRTASYLGGLAEMQRAPATGLRAWDECDARRGALAFHTMLAGRAWNLAFAIKEPVPPLSVCTDLRPFEAAIRRDLIDGLTTSMHAFEKACDAVKRFRKAEKGSADSVERRHLIDLSAGAHAIAARALIEAKERATMARNVFPEHLPDREKTLTAQESIDFAANLRTLQKQFEQTASEVRKFIRPSIDYLSNVLDNQLSHATADAGSIAFEPFEMACAAATLGSAGKWQWRDDRLLRAARFLSAAITPEGFAIARPYHTGGGSYSQPSQPQILGAYAQILEHVADAELPLSVLQRIQRYFEKNETEIAGVGSAWRWAYAGPTWPHSPYHTAICATALDRFCRMLDRRINARVLRHFTTKTTKLPLQDLFYPDYGLVRILESNETSKRFPIAVALERMHAHVVGVKLEAPYDTPFYSAVLHGPPGTGKTTLMEALAVSANLPLVEVTPSDIVFGGTEAVERRADAVLRALSFLTDAVVLFDEFDPVLQSRGTQQGPQSIFTFLTTSMLPKLKRLYDSAKDRRVAFALATNIIRRLDPAAIRSGRFDAWIGVYPPDLLSRYGRLYIEVRRYIDDRNLAALPSDFTARFENAVVETHGTAMPEVGKRGWFTRPAGPPQPGSLFGYLFLGDEKLPPISRPSEEEKKEKTEEEENLWSTTERSELASIAGLEKGGGELGEEIREAIRSAFKTGNGMRPAGTEGLTRLQDVRPPGTGHQP
jgi:hypothetical protein